MLKKRKTPLKVIRKQKVVLTVQQLKNKGVDCFVCRFNRYRGSKCVICSSGNSWDSSINYFELNPKFSLDNVLIDFEVEHEAEVVALKNEIKRLQQKIKLYEYEGKQIEYFNSIQPYVYKK